jgi:hypothetical protein
MFPSDYVTALTDPGLSVDGTSAQVPLQQYLSPKYGGGNRVANILHGALWQILKSREGPRPGDEHFLGVPYERRWRITNGQGRADDIGLLMGSFWRNRDRLSVSVSAEFADYFPDDAGPEDLIGGLVDRKVFGLDCVGFVGRYLEAAGVYNDYPHYVPENYLRNGDFPAITEVSQLDVLCVLVWANNAHVAIIDWIDEWHFDDAWPAYGLVTICQSSSGGPLTYNKCRLEMSGPTPRGLAFELKSGTPDPPVKGPVFVGKKRDLIVMD